MFISGTAVIGWRGSEVILSSAGIELGEEAVSKAVMAFLLQGFLPDDRKGMKIR